MHRSVGMRNTIQTVGLAKTLVLTLACALTTALTPLSGTAQARTLSSSAVQVSRLVGDWRTGATVQLSSSRPLLASQATDLGVAATNTQLTRMILLLEPSATQKSALDAELEAQRTSTSAEYHHWLTPAAFAASYANSSADVAQVAAWLKTSGFTVAALPASRGWIEFSGTAGQVEDAFHTAIHSYSTVSGTRLAVSGSISVPAALQPLIHGLVSLDGALASVAVTTPQTMKTSAAELAAETSAAHAEALSPALVRQLLHLDAVHAAGYKGAGETVALASRSNFSTADVAAFRAAFGLDAGKLKIALDGADPGLASDEAATVLTASWAGVAAPEAEILVVPAQSTAASDGIDLALAAIVNGNQAHTVAVNYSICESALSEAHQAFLAALYRQAAAQGMAVVAATGNSGAAACQAAGASTSVASGLAVNALASTPWNTAVGATAQQASGLAAWSPISEADPAYAGGGGRSTLYSVPSWQTTTATGQTRRSLPDLALPAGIDSGLSRGLAFCLDGTNGECKLVRAGGSGGATALVAGLGAVLASRYGAQGNLAPTLYSVESAQSATFEDVTTGNAKLDCTAGTSGCGTSGKIGFAAATGYDLTTGLGSVNAENLVDNWQVSSDVGTDTSTVTLTLSPTESSSIYNPSTKITLTATVASDTGGATPTGTVTFLDSATTSATSLGTATLSSGTGSITIQSVLSTGSHTLLARYNGSTTYAVSTSSVSTGVIDIEPSSTTVTVSPSTTTPAAGQTISVVTTLGVGSTPPRGDTAPTGTMVLHLTNGSAVYPYSSTLSTSNNTTTATFSITMPGNNATYSLEAIYSGDTNYNSSTSTALSLTAAKGSTTSTLSLSTSSVTAGSTVNVTASVTPSLAVSSYPTGDFSIFMDSTFVTSFALTTLGNPSTGSATITIPTGGNHTITGSFGGDGFYNSSTTNSSTSLYASTDPTSLALTTNTTSYIPGTPVTLTATLTATNTLTTAPSGKVTFSSDGTTLGSSAVSSSGTASYTTSALTAGTHTISATYAGDTNYATSNGSISLNVEKVATTTTLTPATTTTAYSSKLAVTLSVAPSSTAASSYPSGTVTLYVDGNSVGSGTLTQASPSTATVTISAGSMSVGSHVLTATYAGDTSYTTSSSSSVSITVSKMATTSSVSISPSSPTIGVVVTFTAAVAASSYTSTDPTGTVSFKVDGSAVTSSSLTSGEPSTATATISSLTAGSHTVAVSYAGDSYYASSTSASTTVTVSKGATVTSLTASPSTLSTGVTETLTATVAPSDSTITSYAITGTVYFYDGTKLLGSAVLSSNTATLSGVSLSNKTNHLLTAVYAGNTSWLTSTSSVLELDSSLLPVTVVLSANVTTAKPGQAVVLTVLVTPSSSVSASEDNPTGSVIFYNGTTVLGSATLVAVTGTNSSKATLSLTTLPGGTDTIFAVYQGDSYYATATSNSLTLTVEDFIITQVSPLTSVTIVKGSSGTADFVISGLGGFGDLMQVVCSPATQDDMTCTASPQRITPASTTTTTTCPDPGENGCVEFTVATFQSGTSTSNSARNRTPALWQRAAGGTALALVGFFLLPFGRRVRIFAGRSRQFMIFLLLLVGLGCAGMGCTSTTAVTGAGTPLGVTTLKITASDYVDNTVYSKSVYLSVNVVKKSS